jgi:hypothetical protein
MGLLILSLLAAFLAGLIVSTAVYVSEDPNESLSRVASISLTVSGLAGFACGFFLTLALTDADSTNLMRRGLLGLGVGLLSAIAALPTFFVVFFAGELRHHLRSEKTNQAIPLRFRRGPRPTTRRRK